MDHDPAEVVTVYKASSSTGRSAGDAYLAVRFPSHCRKRDWRSQRGSG